MDLVLTEQEIDDLIKNGNLTIQKNINWRPKKNQSFYEFRVPVQNTYQGNSFNLTLVGTKNIRTIRYSFILMLDERYRIRALCPFETHTNRIPQKEIIRPPHKHKWCDLARDTYAYKPTDITNPKDIELTFMQFIKECNITLIGTFTVPPVSQLELAI